MYVHTHREGGREGGRERERERERGGRERERAYMQVHPWQVHNRNMGYQLAIQRTGVMYRYVCTFYTVYGAIRLGNTLVM